jgi:hypothetical protein
MTMTQNAPTTNMNPGDLRYAGQANATATPSNFAKFSTPQGGYGALMNDITAKIKASPNATLADFANTYAPPSDGNNSAKYAADLANQLGVAPNATIGSLQGRIGDFANAVAKNEGYEGPQGSGGTIGTTNATNDNPFQSPQQELANGTAGQTAIGAGKGILQVIRDQSGVDTNPVTKQGLANAPAFAADVNAEKTAIQPSNLAQQEGSQSSQLAAGLLAPGSEGNMALEAARLGKVPEVAADIASPKQTLGTVAKGLMSMTGSFAKKDAKAIEPMVANGLLKAGDDAKTVLNNTNALKEGIVSTNKALQTRLGSMEIKPLASAEDLQGVLQRQMASIEKNVPPSGQAAAKDTAKWLFEKFINNLPKGQSEFPADEILPARQATDAEITNIKGQNVFDPNTETGFTVALRALRQGVNDLVASKAPDQGVKEALSHQTSLYNVLENVAQKGAPAVKKANEISKMTGLKGFAANHPYASGLIGGLVGTGLEAAGLAGAGKILGVGSTNSQ